LISERLVDEIEGIVFCGCDEFDCESHLENDLSQDKKEEEEEPIVCCPNPIFSNSSVQTSSPVYEIRNFLAPSSHEFFNNKYSFLLFCFFCYFIGELKCFTIMEFLIVSLW